MIDLDARIDNIVGDSPSMWCGCVEGDLGDTFPEAKAEALLEIKHLISDVLDYVTPPRLETKCTPQYHAGYDRAISVMATSAKELGL